MGNINSNPLACRVVVANELVLGPSNAEPGLIYIGTCHYRGCDQQGVHLTADQAWHLIDMLKLEIQASEHVDE